MTDPAFAVARLARTQTSIRLPASRTRCAAARLPALGALRFICALAATFFILRACSRAPGLFLRLFTTAALGSAGGAFLLWPILVFALFKFKIEDGRIYVLFG